MDYKELFSLIKANELSGAYVFHGEEEFTKNRALDDLRALIEPSSRSMNIQEYTSANADAIITACNTYPFLSDLRLVIAKSMPDADSARQILGFLPQMPQTTLLVFTVRGKYETKKPTRKKSIQAAKVQKTEKPRDTVDFFAEMEKSGRVCEFNRLPEADLVKWIVRECSSYNVGIGKNEAITIVNRVGHDLTSLRNELHKAIFYVGEGNVIGIAAINQCISPNVEYRVFDMLDYFLKGKPKDGFAALDALFENTAEVVGVSMYLAKQFRLMLRARVLIDRSVPRQRAVEQLGGNPYATGKAYDAAKRFGIAELTDAAQDFSNLMYLQISGYAKINDLISRAITKHLVVKGDNCG